MPFDAAEWNDDPTTLISGRFIKRGSIDKRAWARTWGEWRASTAAMRQRFAMGGVAVKVIDIDPDALFAWAEDNKILDCQTRLEYARHVADLQRLGVG